MDTIFIYFFVCILFSRFWFANLFARALICEKSEGKSEGKVPLEMAHYKALSKGGHLKFPLCPTCHTKYDKGQLTIKQLKKLNLTKEEYQRFQPKKTKAKKKKAVNFLDLPKKKFAKLG